MHFNSQSFMNGQHRCSESESSAYSFGLSTDSNQGMIFQILPKYKLRKEGGFIFFKDHVLIKNTQLNCFINFTIEDKYELDLPITLAKDFVEPYPKVEFRGINTKSVRYQSHLSHQADTVF